MLDKGDLIKLIGEEELILMSAKNNREYKQTENDPESYTDERYELWWLILHVRRVMYKA
ncbi:unnamed protein product, partial [marine sediment metagenome]